MILGLYRNNQPYGVKVPDDKINAVDRLLTSSRAITVGGKRYQDDDIIGLFTEDQWKSIVDSGIVKKEPKSFDDLRKELEQQDWFRKAKNKR